MTTYGLLMCAPVVGLLIAAATIDWRHRRIPNWLTFSLLLSGLAQSFAPHATVTPLGAVLGMLTGFGLTFALFALRAVGGGDVKLLAGIGAWFGPQWALALFCVEAIIGMLMVLAQAAAQGRTRVLLRNSAVVAINLAHVNDVGAPLPKLALWGKLLEDVTPVTITFPLESRRMPLAPSSPRPPNNVE